MLERFKHAAWLLVPCLGLAVPAAALAAAEPRYTYAELAYLHTDFDDYGDGNGFQLDGSVALNRYFHMVAGYEKTDLDHGSDFNAFNIGGGLNVALRPGLDLVGRLRYISASVDQPGDDDEDGYSLEAALRIMINPKLELDGGLVYEDLWDDDTVLQLGALYEIAPNFSLGAGLGVSSDVTVFNLGGRYYFGTVSSPR